MTGKSGLEHPYSRFLPIRKAIVMIQAPLKFNLGAFILPNQNLFSKSVINGVPRALRASVRSTELLLKQKCGRTLCTPPQCFWGKGGGAQKCGTRAKFCEMLGVWGKVFRKIRFAYFLIFWWGFRRASTKKNTQH